jgi:putative restriction endonuclease
MGTWRRAPDFVDGWREEVAMARGRRWTRGELLLALDLYDRLDFGRQHSRNPEVVALAKELGRTPGSVAMKLNNFTSLDPEERARGVKGLEGASELDESVWTAFQVRSPEVAFEIETLRGKAGRTEAESADSMDDLLLGLEKMSGADREVIRRERIGQRMFRRTILSIYDHRCCVTGNPVHGLLAASHIVPWSKSVENRLNPRNGLCLGRAQDAAFDRGLVTFDEDRRLVLGTEIRSRLSHAALKREFGSYEGLRFRAPVKHPPDPELLRWHRERCFKG